MSLRIALFGTAVLTLVAGCAPSTTTTALPPRPTQAAPPVPIPGCSAIAIPSVTLPGDALITPPSAADTVAVTTADMGATVFLIPHQHLVVEAGFPGPAAAQSGPPQGTDIFWTVPQAPDPGPLHQEGSTTCPGGGSLAVFTAVGTGGTTVSATTDASCLHTQPSCGLPQQGFEIYVVVRRPR